MRRLPLYAYRSAGETGFSRVVSCPAGALADRDCFKDRDDDEYLPDGPEMG